MKTWDIDDKVDAAYEMRMEQVSHTIRTGGPATGGITMRDYFAAQMATVMYTACEQDKHADWDYQSVSCAAYSFADQMMRERDRKPTQTYSVEEAFGL